MTEEPFRVDYEPISVPLEELPKAICNRIRLERRTLLDAHHRSLGPTLRVMVELSAATWNSIAYLCSDRKDDARRPEYCTSAPPLARTLLDTLFVVVFLFDRPAGNMRWYVASGWRDALDRHLRLVARRGDDPAWADWLSGHERFVDVAASEAALSEATRGDPESVIWFPHPGGMLSANPKRAPVWRSQERRDFLCFMNDWFYGRLSGASHLSYLGLAERGGLFVGDVASHEEDEHELRRKQELQRSHNVFTSLTLLLALLSEVTGELKLEHEAARLDFIWRYLDQWPEVKELHDVRYQKWLERADGT
jgi:hypothetical protein